MHIFTVKFSSNELQDIILLLACFSYGGKILYNGGILDIGYMNSRPIILSDIINFFHLRKDESIIEMMSFDKQDLRIF